MAFYPTDRSFKVLKDAEQVISTAPLFYSNPLELAEGGSRPRESENRLLPKKVVTYLNGEGVMRFSVWTSFTNGPFDNNYEERLYKLEDCFASSPEEYENDYDVLTKNMYAAITAIASRNSLLSLALNNVPQSYFYSKKHGTSGIKKKLSPNLYKRVYITDSLTFKGARTGLMLQSATVKGTYCAIVTLNQGYTNSDEEDEEFIISPITHIMMCLDQPSKGHADNLLKDYIYPTISDVLQDVFDIKVGGSFKTTSDLEGANVLDMGFLTMRELLDSIEKSADLSEKDLGGHLKVVSSEKNSANLIAPLVAMLMATHCGDDYIPEIIHDKTTNWMLKMYSSNSSAWYSLFTSMMLEKLSPFAEFDRSKFNEPLKASVLSFEERETLFRDLKIKK